MKPPPPLPTAAHARRYASLALEFIATAAFFAALLAAVIVTWAGFLAPPL